MLAKQCTRCQRVLTLDHFQRKTPTTPQSRCRECRRALRGATERPTTLSDAFWKYCTKGVPNACWVWQGHFFSNHYGRLEFRRVHYRAHRVAYELHKGPIPDGLRVCHACDNPPCVNPAHLFLGTDKDNAVDAMHKGRKSRRGHVQHGKHVKLTLDQVHTIRALAYATNAQELAHQHGVSLQAIYDIWTKRRWPDII